MNQGLYSVAEVIAMIEKGDLLLLAGDKDLLLQLPRGKWIAGITSLFVEKGETLSTREKIFVHNMTDVAADAKIKVYDVSSISNIFDEAYDNGFSVLILPSLSEVHDEYAYNCSGYSNFACRAVCGWVAATPVYSEYEKNEVSLVFSGESGMSYANSGVVMHIVLPEEKYAEIHAVSAFKPADDGDVFIFEENGQRIENVLVDGVRQNFRQYLLDKQIDRSNNALIVLVGDHATGVIMNVGVYEERERDEEKYVTVAAPVFKGSQYRLAKVDYDYTYDSMNEHEIVFSLSCVGNYVRPDIFANFLMKTNGPFVYGEIAYVLLNYATVYVTVGNFSN
jgi:hypothetical protein